MKTLVLWVWAFWFAILQYLARLHPNQVFYGYEKDPVSCEYLQKEQKHPYFFPGVTLEPNIEIIADPQGILSEIELLIIAIPNQCIESSLSRLKDYLQKNITILNLSKGINNTTLETVSMTLESILAEFPYTYAVLSWGMIASEVVEQKVLGAQIGVLDDAIAQKLSTLFSSPLLSIEITKNYKNIELYGALKNIFALYSGYLEGKWLWLSTIGYHFCELYKDIERLIIELGWVRDMDFSQYALGWDLIATCFGNSRNRYFGKLVGEGKSPHEAYDILKSEKKHAEGYETLKGIKKFVENNDTYPELQKIIMIFL